MLKPLNTHRVFRAHTSPRRFVFLVAIPATFPLKRKYDRQFRTIGGIGEIQIAVQSDIDVVKHLVCPDEHVDMDVPDTIKPVLNAAGAVVLLFPRDRVC